MRTTVAPLGVTALLLQLGQQRATGRLVLSSDMAERTLFLYAGWPVFAQSTHVAERLGPVGVRHRRLSREQVAQALELHRKNGGGIGSALLELGFVDGRGLFELLSLQLMEQLSAVCVADRLRARFYPDRACLDRVALLRLHPLTALLGALRQLPPSERVNLADSLATQQLTAAALPELARIWLREVGLLGNPDQLVTPTSTFDALRGRLIARLRPSFQRAFASSATSDADAPSAREAAELVALTLLVARCANQVDPKRSDESIPLRPLSAGSVLQVLAQPEAAPIPKLDTQVPEYGETEEAVRAYLEGPRDRSLAARMAVWGPAVEAMADEGLNDLLTLYLTLKPDQRPRAVLGVAATASPEQVGQAYAQLAAYLRALSSGAQTPLARCKTAELRECIDRALADLVVEQESDPQHAPARREPTAKPPSRPVAPSEAARDGAPAPSLATPAAAPQGPAPDAQGCAADPDLEAAVAAKDWRALQRLLGPPRDGRPPWIIAGVALLLGMALGWLIHGVV